MFEAYDAALGSSAPQRMSAERWWPAVVATEHLAYRTIAACWAMERSGVEPGDPVIPPGRYPVRTEAGPPPLVSVPPFVTAEASALHQSL